MYCNAAILKGLNINLKLRKTVKRKMHGLHVLLDPTRWQRYVFPKRR